MLSVAPLRPYRHSETTEGETMKTIGIIGGLGPESTLAYYRTIIAACNTGATPLASPEIIIHSSSLNELLTLIDRSAWEEITDWLLARIDSLHRAGAEFVAIASNTPHIVFDRLANRSPLPLISIVAETVREAQQLGVKRIGLLGTRLTMASDLYRTPFEEAGMTVHTPTAPEQERIHQLLFTEIELGIIKESTRDELLAMIQRLEEKEGIEALILGCTELPLILPDQGFGIPFLDTAAIHCRAIVARCLGEA